MSDMIMSLIIFYSSIVCMLKVLVMFFLFLFSWGLCACPPFLCIVYYSLLWSSWQWYGNGLVLAILYMVVVVVVFALVILIFLLTIANGDGDGDGDAMDPGYRVHNLTYLSAEIVSN